MRLAAFLAATILVFTAAAPQALEPRQLNEKLFEAAKKGRTDEAIGFLRQGASVKARDRFGNTALLRNMSQCRNISLLRCPNLWRCITQPWWNRFQSRCTPCSAHFFGLVTQPW